MGLDLLKVLIARVSTSRLRHVILNTIGGKVSTVNSSFALHSMVSWGSVRF